MPEQAEDTVALPARDVQMGHRKIAAGAIGSVSLTPLILFLWGLVDIHLFTTVDLSLPDTIAAQLGALLATLLFYRTKEQFS